MTDPYAAAWLSEMWTPVPEYHPHTPPVKAPSPRQQCPICRRWYAPHRLADHVIDRHPGNVHNAGEAGAA